MNIEKLAKHLKEFTLDEIEMIAECNLKTDIKNLLNNSKLIFEHGVYKYVDNVEKLNFGIFITNSNKNTVITLEEAVEYFINNYVAKFCSKKTNRIYKAAFKLDILPILKKNKITDFNQKDIVTIYNAFLEREFKPIRLKNTMALLKQFLQYCKSEGLIESYTNFHVKRITQKNEFSLERITFED